VSAAAAGGAGLAGAGAQAVRSAAAGVWEMVASLSESGTPPEGMAYMARKNAEALRGEPPQADRIAQQQKEDAAFDEALRREPAANEAVMCTEPGSRVGSVCVLSLGHCGSHKFQTFRPL
jgi:hypothetical protein